MKKIILLAAFFTFALPRVFGQGSLTPPGAPAASMKSLDQIEARTPISWIPYTITNSGSYYLTANLSERLIPYFNVVTHEFYFVNSMEGTNAITITASNVTLDLNGFTLSCSSASAPGAGIMFQGALRNISVVNGFIQGGVTNVNGVYSGNGFRNGVYSSNASTANVRIARVSVVGCRYMGIWLTVNDSTIVESCSVRTVGGTGICANTIKQSMASDCGGDAMDGDLISDCEGQCSGSSDGLYAPTVQNSLGTSKYGRGVCAINAQNVSGVSTTGAGVLVDRVAINCSGSSNGSGTGLSAATAQNCYGYSASGVGVEACVAQNCWGGGGGSGIVVQNVAFGCYGYSKSGVAVSAFIANSCNGETVSGTKISATHNINSY